MSAGCLLFSGLLLRLLLPSLLRVCEPLIKEVIVCSIIRITASVLIAALLILILLVRSLLIRSLLILILLIRSLLIRSLLILILLIRSLLILILLVRSLLILILLVLPGNASRHIPLFPDSDPGATFYSFRGTPSSDLHHCSHP